MATEHFRCSVKATFDQLWRALLEEVEHPERFNPGILSSKILERFNNGILRSVSVPDADVRERITYDYEKKELTSQLIGHPDLVGIIAKKVSATENAAGSWILESSIAWESPNERVNHMIRRNLAKFVTQSLENVKKIAEHGSMNEAQNLS